MEIISKIKKPNLKNPKLIVGLPGIGNAGLVAVEYMINELKLKKMGEIFSPNFPHITMLDSNGIVHRLKCELYYSNKRGKEFIIVTGDGQNITPEWNYQFCYEILKIAKSLGVKDIITLGAFPGSGKSKNIIPAFSDLKTKKKYEKYVKLPKKMPVETIIGPAGLLVSMSSNFGISSVCLMSETVSIPIIADPKAADSLLHVLKKILNINMDHKKIHYAVKDMEERLKKANDISTSLVDMSNEKIKKKKDDLRYIG